MKSLAKLVAVAVTLVASSVLAHADPITGLIQLGGGVSSYNATSITFSNTGNSVFDGSGTLATDFDGGALTFGPVATPPALQGPYTVDGTNYVGDTLFTITDGSDTLTYVLTDISSFSYDAGGDGDLVGSGAGTLTLTDSADGQSTSTTGLFTLSTQLNPVTGQPADVSFSSTVGVAPTPEPSSLLLLGTGLLGSAGMLYRRSRLNSAV